MQVGFMVIAHDGQVEFQVFGSDRPGHPSLVSYAGEKDCQAVFMGRLYYRRDLRARLPEAVRQQPLDDAELALAVYRQLGLAGIEGLEGDFALVIHDGKQRRLIASREAMGGYPIYWLEQGGTVAFATGIRPLVDRLAGHSLNVDFLGSVLMTTNFEIDCFADTPFAGIQRLVPGWSITAELARGTVGLHEFWKWPEKIVDPGTENVAEMASRYGELL
jgi:asparagine synthase (glutamine-hydrolysing)